MFCLWWATCCPPYGFDLRFSFPCAPPRYFANKQRFRRALFELRSGARFVCPARASCAAPLVGEISREPRRGGKPGAPSLGYLSWQDKKGNLPPGNPRQSMRPAIHGSTSSPRTASAVGLPPTVLMLILISENPRGHRNVPTLHAGTFMLRQADGTTSHSIRLSKDASQVAGYQHERLIEFGE